MITPGTRFGPYEVLAPLAAGGMGEVYRARDGRLGREVAIKVLPAAGDGDPERLRRFELEARAASAINHPNLLTVHDVGVEGGNPYLVTELLAGETLRDRLRSGGLALATALDLATQVARGLAAAHARGVAHRDLKPENLFVTADGTVKILDFGLASLDAAEPPAARGGGEAPTPDRPDAFLGTPGYMAPEQVRGLAADARADLFAFGVVLYEMVTGRRAFDGASVAETLSATLRDEPPPAGLPPAGERLLRHCLAKEPERRWQSARDLVLELEALAASLARRAAAPDGELESLAVLPFENRTGDPEADYLAEGIAESLLNDLSRLSRLRVLGRATTFRLGAMVPADVAAREIGVAAVLSGRLLQVAGRLVVRAELTRAEDGSHLWGAQYSHPPGDVLALQEEVRSEIAAALVPRLAGERREGPSRPATASAAAYDLYLKGRYFLNKRTIPASRQALEHFDAAAATDRDYALAWSGLADTLVLLERYGAMPPHTVVERARIAAERALAADETLAEGHCSRGVIAFYYEWDWERGEREFRRALELRPGHATAHHWYGFCLGELGRAEESIAELERALALDPLSLIIQTNLGSTHYFARRWAEAERALREALALEPGFAVAHQWLGRVQLATGRVAEATASLERARELLGAEDPEALASLAHAIAVAGEPARATGLRAELEALAARRWVSPFWLAVAALGSGDRGAVLAGLERAVDERMDWVISLGVEPLFDPLRGEPRFRALLDRIGLPPTARRRG